MFNLISRRTLQHCRWSAAHIFSQKHDLNFLQNHQFSSSSTEKTAKPSGSRSRSRSRSRSKLSYKDPLFTVSYLINSCGLSQERALSASKHVTLKSAERPDSVLEFLQNNEFSSAQISVVIRKYPKLLLCNNPEKTLLPKIEFFHGLGFSRSETNRLLALSQNLLNTSLENQIIPSFNMLSGYFSSGKDTVSCVKRYPDILARNFQTRLADNIELLRKAGVPECNILSLLKRQPRVFMTSSDKFRASIEEVKKMGFDPLHTNFLNAAYVMMAMNRLIWKDKVAVYEACGCSEDAVLVAFRRNPWCMAASKKKIIETLGFFVHEVGYDPIDIIKKPVLFSLSMEKTILPRYSVYQVLLSKGLVKKKLFLTIFKYPKDYFIEKFVKFYCKEAPELLKIYQ